MSPPTRGAWIEIMIVIFRPKGGEGRPPHGGRGLKYNVRQHTRETLKSPPTRGAWIEMFSQSFHRYFQSVAPHTGGVD